MLICSVVWDTHQASLCHAGGHCPQLLHGVGQLLKVPHLSRRGMQHTHTIS